MQHTVKARNKGQQWNLESSHGSELWINREQFVKEHFIHRYDTTIILLWKGNVMCDELYKKNCKQSNKNSFIVKGI